MRKLFLIKVDHTFTDELKVRDHHGVIFHNNLHFHIKKKKLGHRSRDLGSWKILYIYTDQQSHKTIENKTYISNLLHTTRFWN